MRLTVNQASGRLFPVDLLKAISIIAVVSFHSIFVPKSTYEPAAYLIEAIFSPLRFCVPVFLTLSFFLLQRGLEKSSGKPAHLILKKRFIRLLIPTIFWFTLATAIQIPSQNTPVKLAIMILQGNIFSGAYYLLVVLQLLPIFIYLNHWFTKRRNILITMSFQGLIFLLTYAFLFGMFGSQTILILQRIGRPLFVYYFAYIALGAYFYHNWSMVVEISTRISRRLKISLLSLTSLVMFTEYSYLRSVTGERLSPFEYVMFSCMLSVLVGFLCFANVKEDRLSLPVKTGIHLLSKYSLGIFCINGIMSYIFGQIGILFEEDTFSFPEILIIKLVGWGLLLAISLGISILLEKVGLGACVR